MGRLRNREGDAAGGDPVRLEPLGDERAYDALLSGHPEATFYHTRAWARIVLQAFPQLEDASGILHVGATPYALPLFLWKRLRGLAITRHSGFPFLYGGPIPAEPHAWSACLEWLARMRGSLTVIGNPFAGGLAALAAPAGLPRSSEDTHLLELPASIEDYWSSVLTTRKRNDIRRLTQKGVVIETTRAPEDVTRIYELYRQRMAAWARRPRLIYPRALYEGMLRDGGEAVRLYAARYAGETIGGAFIVRWNGLAHYHAGYFDEAKRALRPNILIQERIIRDAIADGCSRYDMLPSAGLASVEAFKESMGGRRTPFPRWERTGTLHRCLRALRPRVSSPARNEGGRDADG
jgi:hypothetical protein